MSRLINFYRGTAPDSEGRMLQEIWAWSDEELEAVHDFIQWLFPLPEPSRFNPEAPLLTPADITAFTKEPLLRDNLRRSFERILSFLGLYWAEDGSVQEGPNFTARAPDVWLAPNHNWLRITRILRSLTLLGLEAEAKALYERLKTLSSGRNLPITTETFRYWTEAVRTR
jgi:hypothetical protein